MAEKPEKCPKCGMAFYRTVQDAGSFLGGDDTLVSYSVDVDEFDCSSRGTRDEGFFNQSGICLMRERDALRARVAELETLDRKWGETYGVQTAALVAAEKRVAELGHVVRRMLKWAHPQITAQGNPPWWDAEFDAIFDEAVVAGYPEPEDGTKRDRRIAELEAALAASVPREVAERGAHLFAMAMMVIATETEEHPDPITIMDDILDKCAYALAIAPFEEEAVVFLHAALARAEAEAKGQHAPARESFASLCADILAWQAATFPHRTPSSITEHLRREATELAKEPGDAEEMADVGLLLIATADASGVDLLSAIRAKLEKNKRRTWGAPDAHGVVSHVEPAEAEARAAGEEPTP